MYKIYTNKLGVPLWYVSKILFIMRLTTIILIASLMQVSAASFAQRITLNEHKTPLERILKSIRMQSGYDVIMDKKVMDKAKSIDVSIQNASVEETMDRVLLGLNLSYTIEDKIIVIEPTNPSFLDKTKTVVQNLFRNIDVRGTVLDENKRPLTGATVKIKGTSRSVSTNVKGEFFLQNVDESGSILISYLGYETQELKAKPNIGSIVLELSKSKLDEVVINTGMFTRDKRIFTGAQATFSGKELRQIGNLNILQSLKTLDPSFMIIADNQLGSNPNQVPKIEVRGKTSLTSSTVRDQFSSDPNQPLFILNGMETTLQQIIDLDINRVQSITLLKDAASTALYGSRAANGVLVVETILPKPGELRVSYSGDFRYEMPDLRDYNMMNSMELVEFQRLAGLYVDVNGTDRIRLDHLYNSRLTEAQRGVNTYWLNVPLQNGFTNGHSVRVSGGSEEFQYGVALSNRNLAGVMKGSDRNTWSGTVDLSYRKDKLNITDQIYVNGFDANESPYGTFSDYVKIAPYYHKQKDDGSVNLDKYLEYNSTASFVTNPLYNAALNSKNNSTNISLQNNLQAIYDLSEDWRLSAGLQLTKGITTAITFVPPGNTTFDNVGVTEKGLYTNKRSDLMAYQGNTMLTYRKVLNKVHSLTGNLRAEIQQQKSTSNGYGSTGFPAGVDGNPAFAYGYTLNGKPSYSEVLVRRVNALGSFNYAYNNKYYADLNYRIDGSTSFGSENKYSPFWSFGLGWTLNREKFMEKATWIDLLRLRGNIGTTGNQALGSFASSSILSYETNLSIFGQGLYLQQLGNAHLEWQNTNNISVGIDATMFGNRLQATLNAYQKLSSPLIVQGSVPASTGVSATPLNVGKLRTKGVEAILRFSPVYQPQKNIIWTLGLTGSMYTSKYENFSNTLKNLNEEERLASSLLRYTDGYSPDELWAVPSLGIDPASGKEVFLKKNGERTFIYDPADIAPSGNGRPKVEGVISSNLNIKGFLLGLNVRYSFSKYVFNQALYEKVENISKSELSFNQDKRALELRWKQPGDVTQFRGISLTDVTPISSRFIQKESYLSGESFNVGYEFSAKNYSWLRAARIQSVRLNGYMNDIFRTTTIRSERGTLYPFSNAFATSLNIYF